MQLDQLGMNRWGYKEVKNGENNSSPSVLDMSNNSEYQKFRQKNNQDPFSSDNVVTGTVIRSCFIITSDFPAHAEISGNDIIFFDDSKGGDGNVTGDTVTLIFRRADQKPGDFIIQKRHGKDDDLDNVMEMFYKAGSFAKQNYLFIGRQGNDQNYNTNYIEINANFNSQSPSVDSNGKFIVVVDKDGVPYTKSFIVMYETTLAAGLSGVRVNIGGEGDGGGVQQSYHDSAGNLKSYIVLDKDGLQYSQAGRVTSAGVASAKFPPGWSVSHPGTGLYTITHNLGHTNYSVVVSAVDNVSAWGGPRSISANSFQVGMNGGSGPADVGFCFSVF